MKLQDFYLTIGLNDKDTKKQEVSKKQAISTIQDVVKDSTIYDCVGCFTHADGTLVKEKSVRVEVYQKTKSEVVAYCEVLKSKLNQECIAVKPDGKVAFFV